MDVARLNLVADATGFKKGTAQARRELDTLPKKARNVQKSMSKSFGAIKNSLFSIKGGIAQLVAGLSFAAIIREGREFGASIGELSAITGATGADLEFLSNKAREFGRTTTLTANEAAEAFKLIASAKPDLLENSAALAATAEQAIILAEATGQALPEAASTLGAALNQFRAGSEDASRFINVLAAGSKRGAALVSEVGEALKFSGAVAADAGLSFETTVAAIEQMSKVAIKGGEAGTGLRNVILRLAATGDRELNPMVVGLATALDNLNARMLSPVELMQIFGVRSLTAAKSLLSNVDALRTMETQLTGTNTALEQQAAKVNNLDGDIKALGSAYSDFKIALEAAMDEGLREFVQGLTGVFRALSDNVDQVIKFIKVIGILSATLVAARLFGPIIAAIGTATTGVVALRGAFSVLNVALVATAAKAAIARTALAFFGGIPGMIIAAVGAFAALVVGMGDTERTAKSLSLTFSELAAEIDNMTLKELEANTVMAKRSFRELQEQSTDATLELFKMRTELAKMDPGDAEFDRLSGDIKIAAAEVENLRNRMVSAREVMASIKQRREGFDFVGPTATPEQLAATAKAETDKMVRSLEDLSQRGRAAMSGLFPNEAEIKKLRDAQQEIKAIQATLAQADPQVRKELEAEGITAAKLAQAYDVLEGKIAKVGKTKKETSDITKTATQELQNLERSIFQATLAAEGNGRVTAAQRMEYELTKGKLKDLTDETKRNAIATKAADLDRLQLLGQLNQQTAAMARENDMATFALQNNGEVSRVTALQYELTHGSLKNLNDEQARANALAEAVRADDLKQRAEGQAVRDSLDPLADYNREMEKLTELLNAGELSQDQFAEATRRAGLANNKAAGIIRDEFGNVLKDLMDGTKSLSDAFKDMAGNILSSINGLVAKKLGEQLFDSIFSPSGSAGTGLGALFSGGGGAAAAGGGGGFMAGLSSLFGFKNGGSAMASQLAVPGYASGGDFRVGGAGGLDSQLVAFRASPNERVTVSRPQDQGGMGGGINVVNNFNVTAPRGQLDRESQAQLATKVGRSVDNAMRRNT